MKKKKNKKKNIFKKKKKKFLKYTKCQMLNLREFLKKISWSQMVQKCLIRLEIAKKKFVGKCRFLAGAAVELPIFFSFTGRHIKF